MTRTAETHDHPKDTASYRHNQLYHQHGMLGKLMAPGNAKKMQAIPNRTVISTPYKTRVQAKRLRRSQLRGLSASPRTRKRSRPERETCCVCGERSMQRLTGHGQCGGDVHPGSLPVAGLLVQLGVLVPELRVLLHLLDELLVEGGHCADPMERSTDRRSRDRASEPRSSVFLVFCGGD
ncbi:hypothetical protein V5799_009620 [Amblyomma americanum]|uniref:Uncharacterized protein n=1 Tax=Amblyomma americanum TaxID=6943 RepID=A0AAQ4FB69_AMBAM